MMVAKAGLPRLANLRHLSTPAFTLVELMIVIAILALLMALLGGTIGGAWEVAVDVQCKHNLSQLHRALYMGRDAALPSPLYWVGFIETVGCEESLICPKGDTSRPDPAAPPPRNPLPGNTADDAPLVPLTPEESCPEQDIEPVRAPSSVMIGAKGALESSTAIRVFCEQKNYLLPSSVQVNISGPGFYDSATSMSGGSVASGTRVNSYFIHFDPVGSEGAQVSGRMNFNGEILGVICLDAQLNASDSVLGAPGTQYPTGTRSRGFESKQEAVTVSGDRRSLTINRFYSTNPGEQARVIVKAKAKDDSGGSSGDSGGGSGAYWAWDADSEGDVGGPTSYAMNALATPSDAWPGQVLLVEYRRTIVELMGNTADRATLLARLAPRHAGLCNVLFVDGHIESLAPEKLVPVARNNPWIGSHGRPPAPPAP